MSETRTPYSAHSAPGGALVTHAGLVALTQDYLAAQGAYVYKVLGGLGSRPGVGDIVACLRGLAIMAEVKTGSGRLSPVQRQEREKWLAAGGIFIEVRRIEDVELALLEAGLIPRARVI